MRTHAAVLRCFALGVILTGAASAQTQTPTVVNWRNGAPNSDVILRNGRGLLILHQAGLSVVVNLEVRRPRQVVIVYVRNGTGQRIELVPSEMNFELADLDGGTFVYQDPDKVAASIRRVSPWAYLFVGMAGMATQQSHTPGTVNMPGGNTAFINSTTTAPDTAARERAIDNLNEARAAKEVAASKVQDVALRENTVLPGEEVWGYVFFCPPKHYSKAYGKGKLEAVLRVPVGDYVFEFPFLWQAKAKPGNQEFEFPDLWKAKR